MRRGKHSAKDLATAVQEAQEQLDRHPVPRDAPAQVLLKPNDVKTRPELFQPREFMYGEREVDTHHAKKLAKHIGYVGELDPIIVVRLGADWVCVDGHHRLDAYRRQKWNRAIKCEWFKGSVWEAVDTSLRTNSSVKLEIPLEDRYENAWKRVVLGRGSKREIVDLCHVGEGTVAKMRRAKAAFEEGPMAGKLLDELGCPLREASWSKVHRVYLNIASTDDADHEAEAAAKLAKAMRARLEGRLSRNPRVTAHALALYDADLVEPLGEALGRQKGQLLPWAEDEFPDEGEQFYFDTEISLYVELEKTIGTLKKLQDRKRTIEALLDERQGGGVQDGAGNARPSGPRGARA
jgi:hypothetical protein